MTGFRTGITCPVCGLTSWHPRDVEHGYCGNCRDWTEGIVVTTTLPVEFFRTESIVVPDDTTNRTGRQ